MHNDCPILVKTWLLQFNFAIGHPGGQVAVAFVTNQPSMPMQSPSPQLPATILKLHHTHTHRL